MNKVIDTHYQGGMPFTQYTLSFMQDSYRNGISALASAFGSRIILSGVEEQSDGYYSKGWVIIDGELMPFERSPKSNVVVVNEVAESRDFEKGGNHQVYFTKTASCAVSGNYTFSDFVRMKSISYMLGTLEAAVSNLTSLTNSYNVHTHSWDSITGKPILFPPSQHRHNWSDLDNVPELNYIFYRGSAKIGDPGASSQINPKFDETTSSDSRLTITHNANALSYMVAGSLRSVGTNWNADNDVIWMVRNLQPKSFELLLREVSSDSQNLYFDYALIKL